MRRKEDLCQEYIGQINQEIKDISEFQGPLIESLKQSVEEYLVEHPNATLPDLYQRYGAPHEIAKLSVQQVDSYKLLAKLRKQRIARLFFLTIACLFIAFFVWKLGCLVINRYVSHPYVVISSGVNDGDMPLPTSMP